MGHKKGLDALENLCAECSAAGVEYLTVFAFSTENWRRPSDEVGFLMGLFCRHCKNRSNGCTNTICA
ncbi:di-trans,poly-cis-decaprenylcistransferase family protein [Neisseria elongata subsp. glycolytica ATCC 29315]|uniref:Di-trans,poly-cis-decaprenylcistransferase family protein n=1 Tax=Neisseria elongata subsp. glycolytica ATCC 29315 TaxID=546263 RepID=D4DV16_NEIEG|nr:di-trans,poly-cis-decaprenylcistransferase family protein [Neisseria elongata subsp. glycolytica ATCC 29315]